VVSKVIHLPLLTNVDVLHSGQVIPPEWTMVVMPPVPVAIDWARKTVKIAIISKINLQFFYQLHARSQVPGAGLQ